MAGLAGLGSLAGGISSGIGQGAQLAQLLQQNQGQAAFGDALAQLYGGGQTSGQQGSSGGGGLGSLAGLLSGGAGGIGSLFGGGQQAQQPQSSAAAPTAAFSPAPNAMPQQSPGALGQPSRAQPAIAQPASPLGGGQQAQPQQQPQQSPQAPQQISGALGQQNAQPPQMGGGQGQQQAGGGPLTLPQLVQGLMKVKPGIRGPQLAQAVQAAIPLMNAQGLQQWRGLQGMLGQERIGQGYDRLAQQAQEFGQKQGQQESQFNRREDQQGQQFNRREDQQGQQFNRREDQQGQQFNRREDQQQAQFQQRQQGVQQRFEQNFAQKAETATTPKDRAALAQYRASATRILFSQGMDDDAKQQALDALDAKYDAAHPARSATPQGGGQGGQSPQPQGQPQRQPGETRVIAGKTWRYKGGDWDAQSSWEPMQ